MCLNRPLKSFRESLLLAKSRIASCVDVFRPFPCPEEGPNLYTDYKKPYPRFQAFIEANYLSLIIFPDNFFYLEPLKRNIVSFQSTLKAKSNSAHNLTIPLTKLFFQLRLFLNWRLSSSAWFENPANQPTIMQPCVQSN
jgi:hypothetical protein